MKTLLVIALLLGGVTAAQACRWGQTCMPHGSGNGVVYCWCNSGPGG